MGTKPTVLAVTSDGAALREVRIVLPLSVLKEQGHIRDYAVTDTSFRNVPEDFTFDVLWLQRIEEPWFVEQIVRCVGQHFVYDLDDLLLARPTYVKFRCEYPSGVIDALRRCGVLTVTSQRLITLLEKYSGLSLASKAMLCPNGCRFPASPRTPEQPAGILWSSSDYAPLTTSFDAVLDAIALFATRHDLPIYCFGYSGDSFRQRFPRLVDCGFVSFWHHKLLLAAYPTMIGVAPLETHADQETQDFINGKSDLKLVDFVGFGHPCVCSQAAPYVDTDLHVGTRVENTKSAWIEGLEEVYASNWTNIAREQETVISCRDMKTLAHDYWLPSISKVRMPEPLSVNDLRKGRVFRMRHKTVTLLQAGFNSSPLLKSIKARVPKRYRSLLKLVLNK